MHPSKRFNFRLVARGEKANRAVLCSTSSLRRCHPSAPITVIDANDDPLIHGSDLPPGCTLFHLRPEDDDIARVVGRGTSKHLYYWRHSPQVLDSIKVAPESYDVYADTDMLFVRPMDLESLILPLQQGRIAMAVDRSTMHYAALLERYISKPQDTLFPITGSRGPMVQGGLLFRNPQNDGGLFDLFWSLACSEARMGRIEKVPWDDMGFLTSLLSHGGPLWSRFLALGHDWNYVADPGLRHAGVLGYVLHFAMRPSPMNTDIEERFANSFMSVNGSSNLPLWEREPDIVQVGYGKVGLAGDSGFFAPRLSIDGKVITNALSLYPPFAVTWRRPAGVHGLSFRPVLANPQLSNPSACLRIRLLCYLDGKLTKDVWVEHTGNSEVNLELNSAECVTLIAPTTSKTAPVPPDSYCHFVLVNPQWIGEPRTT